MLKQLLYGALGLGAVGVLSICDLCSPTARAASPPAATASAATPAATAARQPAAGSVSETKTVRFTIAGMSCGGCVLGTQMVLEQVPGVSKANVNFEKQEAVITYDPTKVTVEALIAAVKTLGYTATPAEG